MRLELSLDSDARTTDIRLGRKGRTGERPPSQVFEAVSGPGQGRSQRPPNVNGRKVRLVVLGSVKILDHGNPFGRTRRSRSNRLFGAVATHDRFH